VLKRIASSTFPWQKCATAKFPKDSKYEGWSVPSVFFFISKASFNEFKTSKLFPRSEKETAT
jgi:hypothetical protein